MGLDLRSRRLLVFNASKPFGSVVIGLLLKMDELHRAWRGKLHPVFVSSEWN